VGNVTRAALSVASDEHEVVGAQLVGEQLILDITFGRQQQEYGTAEVDSRQIELDACLHSSAPTKPQGRETLRSRVLRAHELRFQIDHAKTWLVAGRQY
jgi:hypothetical protein